MIAGNVVKIINKTKIGDLSCTNLNICPIKFYKTLFIVWLSTEDVAVFNKNIRFSAVIDVFVDIEEIL